MQAGYFSSSYFKDIYLYLAQSRLLVKKAAIKGVEILAEKYIILLKIFKFFETLKDRKGNLLQWESNLMPLVCRTSTLDH